MERDLPEKIKIWLGDQGYPFEMQVASRLVKSDFQVTQSKIYSDPETNTKREIDIEAVLEDKTGFLGIHFLLECKKTKKPWIVFTTRNTLSTYNYHHTFGFRTKFTRKLFLYHGGKDIEAMRNDIPWFFNKEDRIGYSATQAFTKGNDSSFIAQMSALKAAHSLRNEEDNSNFDSIKIYFPILVVDGTVFECFLDDQGETRVVETNQIFLQNPYYQDKLEGVNIQIVTKAGLTKFIEEARRLQHVLSTLFSEDIEKLLKR